LAKDAAQIAAGKKYCARAATPHQDAFLAKMRSDGANHRQIGDAAKAGLPFASLDLAPTRTKCTRTGPLPQLLNGFTKRFDVRW